MKVRPLIGSAVVAVTTLAMSACGGGDGGGNEPPSVDPAQACNALSGVSVAADQLSLPTKGATVTAASMESTYCKLSIQIASVDPAAQPINAQLNLPTNWNQKALQMGGGGFNGSLVTGERTAAGAPKQPTPLAAGYATFGSDSGHKASGPNANDAHVEAFLNDEVLNNYAGDQLKKTRDVAVELIRKRYGATPKRVYFSGGSAGGREGLIAAQRFGDSYDGVVAYYPAAGGVPLLLSFGQTSRALAAPGAYLNTAKQVLVRSAVLGACDAMDGASDGIVANPNACTFSTESIRCAGGTDSGDTCLSDAQIGALDAINTSLRLPYALASGETGYPATQVYRGMDLTGAFGTAAPAASSSVFEQPGQYSLYDVFYRGILARDPSAAPLAFDPLNPGPHQTRLSSLSVLLYGANPDLSVFQKRGGKLLLVHGNADPLIPVGWSSTYYQAVVEKMGAGTVNGFLRYFEIPGYGHGDGSFRADWNALAALDQWVETGTPVNQAVVTDVNTATAGRTRPLCRYPTWPKYTGSGDIHRAESFSCSAP